MILLRVLWNTSRAEAVEEERRESSGEKAAGNRSPIFLYQYAKPIRFSHSGTGASPFIAYSWSV